MLIRACEIEIIYFAGKLNVSVAVSVALATSIVAIIIFVLGCWVRKFKSKEVGISDHL